MSGKFLIVYRLISGGDEGGGLVLGGPGEKTREARRSFTSEEQMSFLLK